MTIVYRKTSQKRKIMLAVLFSENTGKFPRKKPLGLYFSKAFFEGLNFGGAFIRRSLYTEGNLRFKIDWTSLQLKGHLCL